MSSAEGDLPSGTVTFLFTDHEGSSRLWDEHPEAMKGAWARHDVVLREAVGVHAAFERAEDAVAAAVEAQRALGAARRMDLNERGERMDEEAAISFALDVIRRVIGTDDNVDTKHPHPTSALRGDRPWH